LAVRPTLLNDASLREIKRRLDEAAPYGETPLYYAISDAMRRFDDQTPGPQQILAITDGVNWQSEDGGVRLTTASAILADLQNRDTRVDIIEFGGKKQFRTDTERQRWTVGHSELREIASTSRGSFHQV